MLNKFIISSTLVGLGIVGTGIYFLVSYRDSNFSSVEERPVLTRQEQEAYKRKLLNKLPDVQLFDYEDDESWRLSGERLSLLLVHYPAGLGDQEAGKSDAESIRDWCYSIADKEWSEDNNDNVHIPDAISKVCQTPVKPEVHEEEGDNGDVDLL